MGCPLGGKEAYRQKFVVNGYSIMNCTECQHAFTDITLKPQEIKEIYSDRYFYGGKYGYPDYTLEKDILIRRGEKYAKLLSRHLQPGLLLDVGAAAGFIMKGFENAGWRTMGIEPNEHMAVYGRENLHMDIRTGTLEEASFAQSFDLVLLIQVIAHLFDLGKSMKHVSEKVKEGGYVLVETWNKNSLSARLLGQYWHEYSPPSTLNFFSKKSLDLLMGHYGFRLISRGRPGKKILGEHARSLLRYKFESSKSLKWLKGLERIIPQKARIPYPSEDLFYAIYQKNTK
ncbi:MAG: class I SAM-dependent methyltransferase [Bacteroidales bacterium]|jgi:SAM-dependent methyltransferase|nr:class I SAM-dependent methyltransferase [Bacteroidales bacterium]NLM93415.1 class I SAM-dependent methyltransferase [Bacteroidales bacterium]